MQNEWIKSGNSYVLRETSEQLEKLPRSVYRVCRNPNTGELYLAQIQVEFEFPYKVYGIELSFINRVIKTYHNTTGNIGVLMNGIKGSGKTVCAQLIANQSDLPIIVVSEFYDKTPTFLNELQQDTVVVFDEYEKVYTDYDHSILTVMDGILNTPYRKLFLLTTNDLHVNSNLLQRPGRIRYAKTFSDLGHQTIMEIVDDLLDYPQFQAEAIEYISTLEIITVDIVKAVISEINIHEEGPSLFKDVFNTKIIDNKFNVFEIKFGENPKPVYLEANISPVKFDENSMYHDFMVNNKDKGSIVQVLSPESFVVQTTEFDDATDGYIHKTYQVERVKGYHKSFVRSYLV